MACGDFRRNLLEAIELDGIRGLGGLSQVEAGNDLKPGSGASGPAFWPPPEHRGDTGRVLALGDGKTVVIAGSADSGLTVCGEVESSGFRRSLPDEHDGGRLFKTLRPDP